MEGFIYFLVGVALTSIVGICVILNNRARTNKLLDAAEARIRILKGDK